MVSIELFEGCKEERLPFIKMTRSKNGRTGTATFIFIKPFFFEENFDSFRQIQGLFLISEKKRITTKEIKVIFKDGQPFLLRAVFFFTKTEEWFDFLNFMVLYSNENGLFFSEIKK